MSIKYQLLIKTKMLKNNDSSFFQILRCCIYHADKCKIPITVGILTFMGSINFHAQLVEHGKNNLETMFKLMRPFSIECVDPNRGGGK